MKTSHTLRMLAICLLALIGCDALGTSDSRPDSVLDGAAGKLGPEITVMTRNVSIGGDIDRVIAAQDVNQVPLLVAQTWQEIVHNDFHVRAEAIAQEIKARRPDVVGLQEITTLWIQDPGDAVIGGQEPATQVVYDYLEILMDALERRGLEYRVAGIVADTEAEMPMVTSPAPTFADVRMQDYDVVLVAPSVEFDNVIAQNFAYDWTVPFGADGLTIKRGYVAFDATIHGQDVRIVSTHLEPVDYPGLQDLQLAQAAELLANVGDGTAIVLGDLNTAPGRPAYDFLMGSGLTDAWAERPGKAPGYTAGYAPNLQPGSDELDERIDLVLFRNGPNAVLTPTQAVITGRDPIEGADFYASDHAGLAVTFVVD